MAFVQTVVIPADRKLLLELTAPDDIPIGDAEISVSIQAARPKTAQTFEDYIGVLAASQAFVGDAVHLQRAMRDEW